MDNSVTLCSLAMLKVRIDQGGDYLEYLRPYVLEILSGRRAEAVDESGVAAELRTAFGLEIPRRTVQVILQRLARERTLARKDGVYQVVHLEQDHAFGAQRAAAEREINTVVNSLVAYADEHLNCQLTVAQGTEALIAFLSQFSIPCLKSYLRGNALPVVSRHSNEHVVLVSQYINEVLIQQLDLFSAFMTLVQGHMLANALLCPDLDAVTSAYKDVTFYFDTPLLIEALGLVGEQERSSLLELVDAVVRLKGRIAYFGHTADELRSAIKGSADYIDSPKGRGTIVTEARKSGRTKSDLILLADRVDEQLQAIGLSLVESPAFDEATHKFEIDENVFASVLDDEVNYHNPRARDYDVRSVRSIYVLRKGRTPGSIENCHAVFVTSNSGFATAAYDYGKNYEQSRDVSAVITDFSLANTAWLKAPLGAPSLPRREVLAFAYAALRPSTEFWSRVVSEVDKLQANGVISARDHQLLRSSYHVQTELMRLTLGNDEALNEQSILETLRRVTAEIKREDAVKLATVEAAHEATRKRLDDELARVDGIKKNIFWRAERQASIEVIALSILIWCGQISVAIAGFVKFDEYPTLARGAIVVAVISAAFRLLGTHFEMKPVKFMKTYIDWRMKTIQHKECERLGLELDGQAWTQNPGESVN